MKKETKKIVRIAAVYAGAVLGAGFASGQELTVFFVRYGMRGLAGCVISGILFIIFGMMVLVGAKKTGQTHYSGYLKAILGKKPGSLLYLVSELFMAVSFCIMLSGSGALFYEQLHMPPIVGVLVTAVICFAVLQGNLKGLTTINMLLVPFMLLGMAFVCTVFMLSQHKESWLILGEESRAYGNILLYVSFNMLTAAAVLVPLARLADKKSSVAAGGALGGCALLVSAFFACVVLYVAYSDISGAQLPLLALSKKISNAASVVYAIVLYMALLTTAAANGFSVVEHFAEKGVGRRAAAALLCVIAIPLSLIPFSQLVESCYTFFGIIGLVVLGGVVCNWFRS